MISVHVDRLGRALARTPNRRGVTRALVGLALTGATGASRSGDAAAKRKRKAKCGPCETRKNGRCKPKPVEAPCVGDGKSGIGQCFADKCIDWPEGTNPDQGCLPADPDSCLSAVCDPLTPQIGVCRHSELGGACRQTSDCFPNLTCIAYRCR